MPGKKLGKQRRKVEGEGLYSEDRKTNIRFLCPMVGNVLFGKKVKPHYLEVLRCRNGSLTAHCQHHGIRIFEQNALVVMELMRTSEEKGNGEA